MDSNSTNVTIQVDNSGPPIVLANPDAEWTEAMIEALAQRVAAQRPRRAELPGELRRAFEEVRAEDSEGRKAVAATLLQEVKLALSQERERLSQQIALAKDETKAQLATKLEEIVKSQERHTAVERELLGQLQHDVERLARLTQEGNYVLAQLITRDDYVSAREAADWGLALQLSGGVRRLETDGTVSISSLARVTPAVRLFGWPWVFEISVPIVLVGTEEWGGYLEPVGGALLAKEKRQPRGAGAEGAVAYSFGMSHWTALVVGLKGGFGCLSYGDPYGGCYWTFGPSFWVDLQLVPGHGPWFGFDAQYAIGAPTPVRRYTGVGAESVRVWADAPELRIGFGYAAAMD